MAILLALKITRNQWLAGVCPLLLGMSVLSGVSGCGGGGYGGGGNSYSSSASSSSSSSSASAMALAVTPIQTFAVELQPEQIFPLPVTRAVATGSFTFNAASGAAIGSVTLTDTTATAVTINDAFAGNSGAVILSLAPSSSTASTWAIANGATLTPNQLSDWLAGKFYVVIDSARYPQGELRAQLLPLGVAVVFADLSGTQAVPAVMTTASGVAAVTVNATNMTAAVNVNAAGVNTASGVELLTGSAGTNGMLLATLVADNSLPGHWLNESVSLTDADIANYNANQWYVNVLTPNHVSGEIRGQFVQPAVH